MARPFSVLRPVARHVVLSGEVPGQLAVAVQHLSREQSVHLGIANQGVLQLLRTGGKPLVLTQYGQQGINVCGCVHGLGSKFKFLTPPLASNNSVLLRKKYEL